MTPADKDRRCAAGVVAVVVAGALMPISMAAHAQSAATATGPARPATALLPGGRLLGEGRLTWFGLRIYDARLFSAAARLPDDRPVDVPFVLELTYARALAGRDIADRSAEEMARLGRGDASRRDAWRERMRSLFPDVDRGDRIAGENRPGRGVRFHLNGSPLGEIDDPAFAEAFFAIWFDPQATDPALRDALLGARAPRS